MYVAFHPADPESFVAVKVLRPRHRGNPALVKGLCEEARILDLLHHPNVVRTHGMIDIDGVPALVMEVLHGLDLARCQRRRRFTVAETVSILQQLLDALAHVHFHDIVHCDVKPANLFWAEGSRLVLTDFGVARPARTARWSRLEGSLGYVAPERFQGAVLPASDLYAVGLIGWELLSGRVACPPGDFSVRRRWHEAEGPELLHKSPPDAPEWLARFLSRLLRREPERRPRDGRAALLLMRDMMRPVAGEVRSVLLPRSAEPGETEPITLSEGVTF